MAYDNPTTVTYTFQAKDFGAGNSSARIRGPKNMRGKVVDVMVDTITETFSATTTQAYVRLGDGSDADAYAELPLGTTATTATAAATVTGTITDTTIPDDENVTVSFVAPTGGTPEGIGTVRVVIDWF